MPRGVERRQVSPIVKAFRDFCRGKPIVEGLRFADALAARTQPPPSIPGGPYHKTSKVYYYTRDARRLVQPPIEVLPQKQIEAGKSAEVKCITPGKVHPYGN
ncbi:NADH dehydrogenase [ubiquinone] 1 alpha subcomplex subunit 7 [Calliopsis andreniformis]|uniref:NADH dehydrogenase [ubiquinone] 1 alpha subcomplex subunit 7 n=1 Tax=Calliopsis andreniformis TaxID=337506 RepID=UPI003FCE0D5A